MKKNYLFGMLALAAMTMVGCSNDEVVNDYSQDNAIQFGTYVGRDASGRGTVIDTNGAEGNLALSNFGVFAFYNDDDVQTEPTAPNFMNNQEVKKHDYVEGASSVAWQTGWEYSPIKYWPNEADDHIDFYAYAPYKPGKTWTDGKIEITIEDEVGKQDDYLVAVPVLDKTKQKVEEYVKFVFGHALSRVGFKVEAVIDELEHTKDTEGDTDGDLDEDEDKTKNPITDGTTISVQEVKLIGKFYNKAELDLVNQKWDYTKAELKAAPFEAFTLGEDNFTDIAEGVTIDKEQLNNSDSYLMLIPQEFEGENKIQVFVKYTVTTVDDKLTGGNSVIENKINSKEFEFKFEQGKAYDFVLHLGLTSVKLSADVRDWDKATDHIVNVPINESTANNQ